MINELIFGLHVFAMVLMVAVAYYTHRTVLTMMVVFSSVVANVFVLKEITLFGFQATTVEVYTIGCVLSLNLLQDRYGRSATRTPLVLSFSAMGLMALASVFQIAYHSQGTDVFDPAYRSIFSSTPRLVFASLISFWVTMQLDVRLFAWLKSNAPSISLAGRFVCSTLFVQAFDTVLYGHLALWGVRSHLWQMIVFAYIIKVILVLSYTPWIQLIHVFDKKGRKWCLPLRLYISPKNQQLG